VAYGRDLDGQFSPPGRLPGGSSRASAVSSLGNRSFRIVIESAVNSAIIALDTVTNAESSEALISSSINSNCWVSSCSSTR
jgi:hypothetical protein